MTTSISNKTEKIQEVQRKIMSYRAAVFISHRKYQSNIYLKSVQKKTEKHYQVNCRADTQMQQISSLKILVICLL